MINQAFRGFRPIGLENPYQIRSEETTFQQQIKNPKMNSPELITVGSRGPRGPRGPKGPKGTYFHLFSPLWG